MSVNINHQLEQVNNLKITPVGTGATVGTAGIVTYYGDGSQLSGVSGGGSSVWSTSGNDAYYTTGNVGIGTNAPTAKLDVRGTLNVTGVSTFQDNIHLLFGDQIKFYGSPSTQLNLEIYDSNAHAYVAKRAGSDLILVNHVDNKDVVIQTDNGSGSFTDYYRADGSSGESILYHYGSQKLATKSNGIDVSGSVSATSFTGDGSGLTNITATGSGVGIQSNTSIVGTAQTINFGTNLAATISGGVATITATGGGGGSSTTRSVNRYVANNGDTLFPPSGTVSYDVGYIDVYLNGSKLDSTEYTATNGTTVTLTTGASQNDIVELVAYTSVNLANVEVVNDTTPQLGGNLDLNGNTISDGTDGGTLVNREEAIAYAIAFG